MLPLKNEAVVCCVHPKLSSQLVKKLAQIYQKVPGTFWWMKKNS